MSPVRTLFSAFRTVYNLPGRQYIGDGGVSNSANRYPPAPWRSRKGAARLRF